MHVIAYQYEDEAWKPLALCTNRSNATKILNYLVAPHILTRTNDTHKFIIAHFNWF